MVMGFTAFGLSIVAKNGVAIDSEQVLPLMINQVFPAGFKGLVIAALLAAFMSTFGSTLNVAASFIVNDMVKPVWTSASPKALIRVSYASTIAIILLGIVISRYTERIDAIWNPINFALGAALLAPGLFAAYWWRMGGWALCLSAACTLPAAFYVKVFTDMRELQYFPILAGISFASCIAGAYLFPPAPDATLMDFYRKVRPFGLWGPVRAMLRDAGEDPGLPARDRLDIPWRSRARRSSSCSTCSSWISSCTTGPAPQRRRRLPRHRIFCTSSGGGGSIRWIKGRKGPNP